MTEAKQRIAYKIIAVPDRASLVSDLLFKLKVDAQVYMDYEKRGCIWNALRAWGDYKELSSDYTHICVLQDDIDIVNQFTECTQECANHFPDAIFGFMSNWLSLSKHKTTTPYINMLNYNISGCCIMMPIKYINGFIDMYMNWFPDLSYNFDDAFCRIYALVNNIPVFSVLPNIIKCKEVPSQIAHHRTNFSLCAWQGYDIDLKRFSTNEYVNVAVSKKGVLNTHLPKDHPLNILCRETMQKRRLQRRL